MVDGPEGRCCGSCALSLSTSCHDVLAARRTVKLLWCRRPAPILQMDGAWGVGLGHRNNFMVSVTLKHMHDATRAWPVWSTKQHERLSSAATDLTTHRSGDRCYPAVHWLQRVRHV